jgi:hypothetical protein
VGLTQANEDARIETTASSEGRFTGEGPPTARRQAPPEGGMLLHCGYLLAGAAGAAALLAALPPAAAGRIGLVLAAAMVVVGSLGAALPDAFERRHSAASGILGARRLASLLHEAGYRNTVAHSAGALLLLAVLLAPLPLLIGRVCGGALFLGILCGYVSHLILDVALRDKTERIPLGWPFIRGPRSGIQPLLSSSFPRTGTVGGLLRRKGLLGALLVGCSLAVMATASLAYLRVLRVPSLEIAWVLFKRSGAALPDGVLYKVSTNPEALLALPLYVTLLLCVRRWLMPLALRRAAIYARDDETRRHVGGLKGWKVVPLKGSRLDPRRLEGLFKRLPLEEEGLSLEQYVGEEVEARLCGRAAEAAARLLTSTYADLATVRSLSSAEALFFGPVVDKRRESEAEAGGLERLDLVPVLCRYEIRGERPELGLVSLPELPEEPLGPALSAVRDAVRDASGERAFVRIHVRPAPARAKEELMKTLEKYEPPTMSEKAAYQRKLNDQEASRTAEKYRRGSYPAGRSGVPSAEDAIEHAFEMLFVVLGDLLVFVLRSCWAVVRLIFGRRGPRDPFGGRPERVQEGSRVVRRRMAENLFSVQLEAVGYLAPGEDLAGRSQQLRLAFSQYFAAFARGEDAYVVEKSYAVGEAVGGSVAEAELRLVRVPARRSATLLGALTAEEISGLWRPLGAEVGVNDRAESTLVVKAPTSRLSREGVVIGYSNHPGYEGAPIHLGEMALRRHIVIRGITGMGKTAEMYLQCMEVLTKPGVSVDRMGLMLLDPTRSLFDNVLANFPKHRVKDLVVFDPVDEEFECPSYNLFDPVDYLTEQELAMIVVRALESRFPNSFGNRMRPLTYNASLAMIAANSALMDAGLQPRFTALDLMETRFLAPRRETEDGVEIPAVRAEVLSWLETDSRWTDVLEFWRNRDRTQSAAKQEEQWSPIWSIAQAMATPKLARIFGEPRRDFDFYELMEGGGVLLANLDKGSLDDAAVEFAGTIFLELARKAASARYSKAASAGRDDVSLREFGVCCDEIQDFACEELETVFTQGRKWALPIIGAHQHAEQLPKKLRSAFSNASTRIFFRAADEDKVAAVSAIGDAMFTPELLGSYPEHNFVLKLGTEVVTSATRPLPPRTDANERWADFLRDASAPRLGRGAVPSPPAAGFGSVAAPDPNPGSIESVEDFYAMEPASDEPVVHGGAEADRTEDGLVADDMFDDEPDDELYDGRTDQAPQ